MVNVCISKPSLRLDSIPKIQGIFGGSHLVAAAIAQLFVRFDEL